MTTASAIAATAEIAATDVVEGIANLVAKSLVRADVGDASQQYRLLETTRAYALGKLGDSGEFDTVARHAAGTAEDLFLRALVGTRSTS